MSIWGNLQAADGGSGLFPSPLRLDLGNKAPQLFLLSLPPFECTGLFEELAVFCGDGRRKRAQVFRQPADRIRCLAAGWLLDHAVVALTGQRPEEGREAGGKPLLLNHPVLEISISHSGNLVVCALCSSLVGVDLEMLHEPVEGTAELFMSQQELQKYLATDDPVAALQHYYRLWTTKEAYLKATGTGLAVQPHSIDAEEILNSGVISAAGWCGISGILPNYAGWLSLVWCV